MRSARSTIRLVSCALALPLWLGGLASCGEDDAAPAGQRGLPGGVKAIAKAPSGGGGGGGGEGEAAEPGAEGETALQRPRPVLTRDDFHPELTRDPFRSFLGTEVVELQPDRQRAQRDVRLGEYNFEDLKLIAIVMSGRNVVPRALFLATDGKSKAIKQGEYFSRAEVLLAAVNRDYVEIEVVDEDLAGSLNLTRGERRAIYLKTE